MGRHLELRSGGPDDTRRIAAGVAGHLRPGDVVTLTGELGAGKTCFVQGAAPVLGVTDRVTSPSFVLRRDYDGDVGVVHIDIYRLDSLQDVVELGFEDVFDRRRITFVEWGDAMSPLLPAEHLEVELRRGAGAGVDADPDEDTGVEPEERILRLRAHGEGWTRRLDALAEDLAGWLRPTGAAGSPGAAGPADGGAAGGAGDAGGGA